ncbi:MAG TPA: maltose alpha-D-glucosyltransferase [Bryobacteraceae bacterium]|nr:maltose alpha-D-glucosyltransferase [Bryobacteraceae bacterium]
MKKLASAIDPLWYKDAIIYELHVRAFCDSNGDGIGDFPGLLSHIDYLQDLGVTCIWLLPFFPSPLRDDGYDIANYTDVNPSYGTLGDFKAVLDAAHQRGMQVMIELVINHTSDQHPWFTAAREAAPGSPERDMYVWSQTDQKYKEARIIFTDTEKSNWTWDDTAKAYYWHRFFSHQPDLNYDSPLVLDEVLKAMRFWLDMGVDGLRMDAIPYLVEREGTNCENLPETHAAVRKLRAAIDAEYANRVILAEANQWPADVRPYFGDGDECHMAFHFPLMPRIYMALRQEDRLPITDIVAQTPPIPDSCQWGLFLRNHDELTLEMVTDEERDYMYFAYSADPRMRVNVGIRRRLAPLMDNSRRRIELLNSLLLSFPGTPILYYGDEIGMGDNIYLGDRNGVRTPMQWTSDRNAGFSRSDPARLYFPVIMDPIYGYQVVNVEAQLSDQSSLLHWTRNMIALRKLFQVFGRGSFTLLNSANRRILSYIRDLDRGDGTRETVLCVANLSRFAQPVTLELADYAGMTPVEMLGYVSFPTITEAPYALSLAPYSFMWFELQPASRNEPADEPRVDTAQAADPPEEGIAAEVLARGWAGLLAAHRLSTIENALPEWLHRQRWFGAKARKIQSARVLDWVELNAARLSEPAGESAGAIPPALFFVEVGYADGGCDLYQIPLAIDTGAEADEIRATRPLSVIVALAFPMGPAILHDATVSESFRRAPLRLISQNATLGLLSTGNGKAAPCGSHAPDEMEDVSRAPAPGPAPARHRMQPRESPLTGEGKAESGILNARPSSAFPRTHAFDTLPSHVGSAEQSNTSIVYGDQLILKLFRRLQPGENPDVEMGRFLTEVAHFPHIPPFLGEIEMTRPGWTKTTLAMLQGLVQNEGDGWEWFLDRLIAFFSAAAAEPAPELPTAPGFLVDFDPDPALMQHARDSLEAAELLGRRTAELHIALATPTRDTAFAAERFTSEDFAREADRIASELSSALEVLKSKIGTLDDAACDDAGLLLSRRRELLERARSVAGLRTAGMRIRIHGDYHLGQVLRVAKESSNGANSEGDFVLLDFEGEPARPLAERRQKHSPLKDVAGMIRSFSYAASTALDRRIGTSAEPADRASSSGVTGWARCWYGTASAMFLRSYRETMATGPAILPPGPDCQPLFAAYLLEKAVYELVYELNNRPAWVRIPIAGILNT